VHEVQQRFGRAVATIVEACSDTEDHTDKGPWRERKEQYLAHLSSVGDDALRVSLADKLSNARSILLDLRAVGPEVFDRFKGRRDGTLWYYRSLADKFRAIRPGPLADELVDTVTRMEAMASG
jgi:(p)ppGpp synthase/HD superfamily hydrolase